MLLGADRVRVTVPATSANLGPGFDSLGIAFELRDVVEVRALGAAQTVVEVTGEGAGTVPTDDSHLVVRALHAGLDYAGAPLVGVHMACHNATAHGRGLGSSAAAVVAGLFAARGLIADQRALDDAAVLAIATEFEGHPDNVAPAIFGGATVAWTTAAGDEAAAPDDAQWRDGIVAAAHRVPIHPDLAAWVAVPDFELATSRARKALPAQVPFADAAFNVARAALLATALQNDPDVLFAATQDRLHQHYRATAMPQSWALVQELRGRGLAAVISGAGPTVLVLGRHDDGDTVRQAFRAALAVPAVAEGSRWRVAPVRIASHGATVERIG